MKVAVTGGTGFIGKNLLKVFHSRGIEAVSIQRSESEQEVPWRVWLYKGDFAQLQDFFLAEKFDGIIHLASHFVAEHKVEDVPKLVHSNIEFPSLILEAAAGSGIRWFLNTGTFWQHFKDSSFDPVNLYAASKQAFEDIGAYYDNTGRIVFRTLKISDTFGPGDPRNKLAKALKLALQDAKSFAMSEGKQHLSILYIDDVVAGFVELARALDAGEITRGSSKTFALAPAETICLRDFVSLFSEVGGKPIDVEWGARPYREREVMQPWTSYQLLPNWRAETNLREGIRKYLSSTD